MSTQPKSPKKRMRPGQARIEFLAVQPEIEALLDQGYTFAGAYEKLKADGKFTSSYEAVYRLYRGITPLRTVIKRHGQAPSSIAPGPIVTDQEAATPETPEQPLPVARPHLPQVLQKEDKKISTNYPNQELFGE